MHRCANNPRAMREARHYLGDVAGEPLLPKRPLPRAEDWRDDVRSIAAPIIIVCLSLAFLIAGVVLASGHDDADWIRQYGYKNMVGELCCGAQDCAALTDGDVRIDAGGYYIKSLRELVPFEKSLPAPGDAGGRYWRCAWGGQRKCFFAPPGSS